MTRKEEKKGKAITWSLLLALGLCVIYKSGIIGVVAAVSTRPGFGDRHAALHHCRGAADDESERTEHRDAARRVWALCAASAVESNAVFSSVLAMLLLPAYYKRIGLSPV